LAAKSTFGARLFSAAPDEFSEACEVFVSGGASAHLKANLEGDGALQIHFFAYEKLNESLEGRRADEPRRRSFPARRWPEN
jgi:hypothetical protein